MVGPSVTGYLAIRRQVNQQEHERASEDLEDLRALLAEAARDLRRASGLLGAMVALLLRLGEKIVTDTSSVAHIEEMNDAQIAIRLDSANPVADAHRDAVAAIERGAKAIGRVGGLGGASLAETNAEITAARNALAEARTRFGRAARAEVGIGVRSRG